MKAGASWTVLQIGAREHYALARGLEREGRLRALLTDVWVPPGTAWARGPAGRAASRYHADLAEVPVESWSRGFLALEAALRVSRAGRWTGNRWRNGMFRRLTQRALDRRWHVGSEDGERLAAYSYAALGGFRAARKAGVPRILLQIDAGPELERTVERLRSAGPGEGWGSHLVSEARTRTAPPSYFASWREEGALADVVVANSRYVARCLREEGVEAGRIAVVPLAYAPPSAARGFRRGYPERFTEERPLRLLFVGQVWAPKGIGALLEAMERLEGRPVELDVVGPVRLTVAERMRHHPRVHWRGRVPRESVHPHFQRADLLVFPTLCDGFGMVQLEAQAWRLPVLATATCGDVVEDGRNGLVVRDPRAAGIVAAVEACLAEPGRLAAFADAATDLEAYSLGAVTRRLLEEVGGRLEESPGSRRARCGVPASLPA